MGHFCNVMMILFVLLQDSDGICSLNETLHMHRKSLANL